MFLWGSHVWIDRAKRSVERLAASINGRNVPAIKALVTPDIRFIDSMGDRVVGWPAASLMLERLVTHAPDLRLHLDEMTDHDNVVLVTGRVEGSRRLASGRTLWRVALRDGLVAEWRSFSADNPQPIIRRLMGHRAQDFA